MQKQFFLIVHHLYFHSVPFLKQLALLCLAVHLTRFDSFHEVYVHARFFFRDDYFLCCLLFPFSYMLDCITLTLYNFLGYQFSLVPFRSLHAVRHIVQVGLFVEHDGGFSACLHLYNMVTNIENRFFNKVNFS